MEPMRITINEDIRDELDRLYEKHGMLSDEIVAKASKRKNSPLRAIFLWDDEPAAAWVGRLEIARQLIMRVKILPSEVEDMELSVRIRKYHGNIGGGYRDVRDVANDEELRARLLASAARDLQAFKTRYQMLSELAPVFQEIEKLAESVT